MKLIDDWERVLKRAWSIRFVALAGLFTGLEVIVPLFSDAVPKSVFGVMSFVSAIGAFWARLTVQKGVSDATDK